MPALLVQHRNVHARLQPAQTPGQQPPSVGKAKSHSSVSASGTALVGSSNTHTGIPKNHTRQHETLHWPPRPTPPATLGGRNHPQDHAQIISTSFTRTKTKTTNRSPDAQPAAGERSREEEFSHSQFMAARSLDSLPTCCICYSRRSTLIRYAPLGGWCNSLKLHLLALFSAPERNYCNHLIIYQLKINIFKRKSDAPSY